MTDRATLPASRHSSWGTAGTASRAPWPRSSSSGGPAGPRRVLSTPEAQSSSGGTKGSAPQGWRPGPAPHPGEGLAPSPGARVPTHGCERAEAGPAE